MIALLTSLLAIASNLAAPARITGTQALGASIRCLVCHRTIHPLLFCSHTVLDMGLFGVVDVLSREVNNVDAERNI